MTSAEALERYTSAVEALKDHIKETHQLFDAHQRLVQKKIDAENDLRDAADEEYRAEPWSGPLSNGIFKVTVAKQDQVYADIETLDAFVKQGVISPEVRNQIVKTQERPLRISITSEPNPGRE